MPQALVALYLIALCLPGAAVFWWLMTALDPSLVQAIPAPRVEVPLGFEDVQISPVHNDWRGFT